MKRLKPTPSGTPGVDRPRHAVKSIECRKRDLVIRIADWRRMKDASGYDVECYIGGIYDYNESDGCLSKHDAIRFACEKIAKLL